MATRSTERKVKVENSGTVPAFLGRKPCMLMFPKRNTRALDIPDT